MKLLYTLIILFAFFMGCDDGEDPLKELFYDLPPVAEWICTTDASNGSPLPETYNSLVECESVCPNEPVEVTTPYFPDGTGEYFSMYCSESE